MKVRKLSFCIAEPPRILFKDTAESLKTANSLPNWGAGFQPAAAAVFEHLLIVA
jgi:hypothetical protein